jgi:hypothetical protein
VPSEQPITSSGFVVEVVDVEVVDVEVVDVEVVVLLVVVVLVVVPVVVDVELVVVLVVVVEPVVEVEPVLVLVVGPVSVPVSVVPLAPPPPSDSPASMLLRAPHAPASATIAERPAHAQSAPATTPARPGVAGLPLFMTRHLNPDHSRGVRAPAPIDRRKTPPRGPPPLLVFARAPRPR